MTRDRWLWVLFASYFGVLTAIGMWDRWSCLEYRLETRWEFVWNPRTRTDDLTPYRVYTCARRR